MYCSTAGQIINQSFTCSLSPVSGEGESRGPVAHACFMQALTPPPAATAQRAPAPGYCTWVLHLAPLHLTGCDTVSRGRLRVSCAAPSPRQRSTLPAWRAQLSRDRGSSAFPIHLPAPTSDNQCGFSSIWRSTLARLPPLRTALRGGPRVEICPWAFPFVLQQTRERRGEAKPNHHHRRMPKALAAGYTRALCAVRCAAWHAASMVSCVITEHCGACPVGGWRRKRARPGWARPGMGPAGHQARQPSQQRCAQMQPEVPAM